MASVSGSLYTRPPAGGGSRSITRHRVICAHCNLPFSVWSLLKQLFCSRQRSQYSTERSLDFVKCPQEMVRKKCAREHCRAKPAIASSRYLVKLHEGILEQAIKVTTSPEHTCDTCHVHCMRPTETRSRNRERSTSVDRPNQTNSSITLDEPLCLASHPTNQRAWTITSSRSDGQGHRNFRQSDEERRQVHPSVKHKAAERVYLLSATGTN